MAPVRLGGRLSLNADQRARLEAIFNRRRERLEAFHREVRSRFESEQKDLRNEIAQVLTPEQQAEFERLVRERPRDVFGGGSARRRRP